MNSCLFSKITGPTNVIEDYLTLENVTTKVEVTLLHSSTVALVSVTTVIHVGMKYFLLKMLHTGYDDDNGNIKGSTILEIWRFLLEKKIQRSW